MNTIQRIAKNSLFLLITQLTNSIIGIFLVIYIARHFGPDNFGNYSFIISLTGLYYILSDFGISSLVIREVAKNRKNVKDYIGNGLILKIPLTIFMFSVIIISNNFMMYENDVKLGIYLGAVIVSFNSFYVFINSIFHAFEKMEYSAIIMIVEKALLITAVTFIIYHDYGFVELLLLSALISCVKFVISLIIYTFAFKSLSLKYDFSFLKSLLIDSIPFGLNIILAIIYFNIDIVMIGLIQNSESVGIYTAAVKIIVGIMIIPDVFSRSLLPVMSRYFQESLEKFNKSIVKSFKYLFVISIPLLVIGIIYGSTILNYLYTKEYKNTIFVFQILLIILPFRFVNHSLGISLTTMNRQWYRTSSAFICALVNIGLNLIFITKWSYVGAAWATLVTEIILFIQYYCYVSRFSIRILIWKNIGHPILAGLLMTGIGMVFSDFSLFIIIPVMIVTYIGYLLIVKDFSSDDILIFNRLINRKA